MGELTHAQIDDKITARFWRKVDKAGPVPGHRPELGECWVWTAALNASGYGTFGVARRGVLAHRWSYTAFVGPIPGGLLIDHLCRNRACVNPGHMEPATRAENNHRSLTGRRGHEQRSRTHCPQGHPYDEANTYPRPDGGRNCRACGREHARTKRAGKKVA